MKKILIVEDEFIEAKNLERMLVAAGFAITGIARSVQIATKLISDTRPDFVLIDIFLKGDLTGIDLARILSQQHIPFLYLSANTNKSTLEAAKQTRPYGFLVKPFREKDVLVMLEIAIYHYENRLDVLLHREQPKTKVEICDSFPNSQGIPNVIGSSNELMEVLKLVRVVAPSEASILITGESGTGKEMIAKSLHVLSPRKDFPFVAVNCAALPSTLIESILFGYERGSFTGAREKATGKFEQAQRGTLFLDEIGEISPEIQVKLLRVLQEKELERVGGKDPVKLDVRIIAATNRNLEAEISKGRFRMDLYYRLNVFPIHIPPLRQRKTDIPELANHFVAKFCEKEKKAVFELPTLLIDKLVDYHWPGNIRELENVIKRIVLLDIRPSNRSLDGFLMPGSSHHDTQTWDVDSSNSSGYNIKTWQDFERSYIVFVLKKCNGKISGENGAAQFLHLPAKTLESKMKKLGIHKKDYLDTI